MPEVLTSLVQELKQREPALAKEVKWRAFMSCLRDTFIEDTCLLICKCFVAFLVLMNITSFYLLLDLFLKPSTLLLHFAYYALAFVLFLAQLGIILGVLIATKWPVYIQLFACLELVIVTIGMPTFYLIREPGLAVRFGIICGTNAVLSVPTVILWCYIISYHRGFVARIRGY